MTILVDDAKHYPNCKLRYKNWSHMVSDNSFEELHLFALKLGLKKEWFQGNHYDIIPSKRQLALKLGAVGVSSKELVKRMFKG